MATTDEDASTRELLKAELEEEIARLITVGATEGALIAAVAYLAGQFPDMTTAELSAAIRDAMAAAERRVANRP
jgi:hypothetical protein